MSEDHLYPIAGTPVQWAARSRLRGQRRIVRAALVASVVSGAPSTTWALLRSSPGAALAAGLDATRAIGTLVPPGRPGLVRGAVAHLAISLAVGEALAFLVPRERAVAWGTLAGLGVGWLNLGVIAPRAFPAIAALPLGPQLADNAAFGAVFAAWVDRRTAGSRVAHRGEGDPESRG